MAHSVPPQAEYHLWFGHSLPLNPAFNWIHLLTRLVGRFYLAFQGLPQDRWEMRIICGQTITNALWACSKFFNEFHSLQLILTQRPCLVNSTWLICIADWFRYRAMGKSPAHRRSMRNYARRISGS